MYLRLMVAILSIRKMIPGAIKNNQNLGGAVRRASP